MLLPLQNRSIAYDLMGPESGPVVCFTHSLASDGGMWAEQVPALLAAGFRVLRVDMRGHGGSDPVAGDYTMEQLAADTAAVVDALGFRQVHYIGLSIGGMQGQAFALNHGAKLKSMMLCDTMPQSPAAPEAKAAWSARVKMVREANSVAPLADATMDRWFTDAFKPRKPGRWKEIRDTVAATTPQGFLGCAAAIQNFDFLARLPSIKVPTLVVCGADDPGTPPAANKKIAELIPHGRYEEIPNARHFPNVEHPEVFNRIMMGWLSSQR
jgi:3-oxoadipate enol-lactonase